MKCNLECSYCESGTYGGRDNSTAHPPVSECLDSIDFMFKYADMYMSSKPPGLKYTVLNVYGGESLHHPEIVEILQQARERHKQYQDSWDLTITTTTNAIISERKLGDILPLVDEFTVSYHVENTDKNKQLFCDNLLAIKAAGRRQKCIVLVHPEPELFADCQQMIAWLEQHQIQHLPRQIDHPITYTQFNYPQEQVVWFDKLYKTKGTHTLIDASGNNTDLADTGRACCGGRQLCANQDYRNKQFFVSNKFTDWFCSVNHFFLYVKQVNGEIFSNKDCKMNFDSEIGPIGNLSNAQALLNQTKAWLETNTMPVIQCKKGKCFCGLCAPKAQTLEVYNKIFNKYIRK